MADINEIGKIPDGMKDTQSKPEGASLFFGDKERDFFINAGREISEGILKESFLLYRIDLEKTQANFYGEAKKKVWLPEIQIYGLINVEVGESTYKANGALEKKGMGKITINIFVQQLETLGLLKKQIGTGVVIYDIPPGCYIGYKNEFYKIYDNGFSQISNKYMYAGDRKFFVALHGVEIDEDVFKAR